MLGMSGVVVAHEVLEGLDDGVGDGVVGFEGQRSGNPLRGAVVARGGSVRRHEAEDHQAIPVDHHEVEVRPPHRL